MKYTAILLVTFLISSCSSTISNCHGTHGCNVDRGDTATGVLNAIGNIVPSFIK